MAKRKPKSWGIWVNSIKSWLTTDGGRRKARYEFKREALKEAHEFNTMWRGRKQVYEARKIK
tara:strand:- start:80 stop:265 length:186 start_codon:yes stop_codon:yes gene_type:complete